MPKRYNEPSSEPATLNPNEAVLLIRRQIKRLSEAGRLRYDDPRVDAWEAITYDILDKTFGRPQGEYHQKTRETMEPYAGPVRFRMTSGEIQRNHQTRSQKRKVLLEVIIEQLNQALRCQPLKDEVKTES